MIYYNYDIHLRATVRFTVIKMEMDWKNMQYLCKYRLITETAFHRYWSDCSTDFGKFPGKKPWWSLILV